MTYYVTALTNDKAKLIVHEVRTTDKLIADMAACVWEERGMIVTTREDD